MTQQNAAQLDSTAKQGTTATPLPVERKLAARLEPFDSYWQAPDDVEAGYTSFYEYYKYNYLPHLPENKQANILVISCGPGYLVNLLAEQGYKNVLGIDSDADKIAHGKKRNLNCETHEAFPFLQNRSEEFDVIIPEQELNHLTLEESLSFLKLCHTALREGGSMIVYGLNGANPLVGSENLSHNIDHFYTFTEYSFGQVLEICGFKKIKVLPLKLYVFWKNPLNYVGLAVTSVFELLCRVMFILYGKKVKVLSKKLAAVCYK